VNDVNTTPTANPVDADRVDADRVDADRLWSRLMAMAQVAPTVNGGSNRQALSDDDAAGRALFLGWATAAGCTHEIDEIGNLFVRRPGLDPDAPPVLIGSHLDTQPTGGRFDGVYGVLGGLEVIERLNDLGIQTETPIDLVVWTNEEGSRFQVSMMGSGVWAQKLSVDDACALTDIDGVTVGEELDRLGWRGARPAQPTPLTGSFELHIEQGPILEAEELEIGVVTGVQGLRWFTIELGGFPAHAGPTPMEGRKDPARVIARIVSRVYGLVDERAPWARGTFAQFGSEPVSPNTIPERLWCTLDLRHPEGEVLEEMESLMRTIVAEEADAHGVTHSITKRMDSAPVAFDENCVASVEEAVAELGFTNHRMFSGAGHDACYVALHAPTSMIFVPCDDGLSHNEAENITKEQAERGASVLLGAVRRMAGA
jgi:beta-ureidopropionase / N-carbamoyl-L-amino-acid hydrolase